MDDGDETQGRQQQQQQQGHQTAEHVDAACGHRAVPCDAVIINSTTQTHRSLHQQVEQSSPQQHQQLHSTSENMSKYTHDTQDLLDDFLFISTDICKY